MKYYFFFVEGAHDCEALGRILKRCNYRVVKKIGQLPDELANTIPKKYPFEDDNLERVASIGEFWKSNNSWACIYSAGGYDNLPSKICSTLHRAEVPLIVDLQRVGVLCDADEHTAENRKSDIVEKIREIGEENKAYTLNNCRLKLNDKDAAMDLLVYVFPDDLNRGTLETMIIEEAKIIYEDLLNPADTYLGTIPTKYTEGYNQCKRDKALVGVMANVFQPGKANQISINKGNWFVSESEKSILSHKKLAEFVRTMISE